MNGRGVVVIGGGVVGVASAYYLTRDGWDVTLLDKSGICAGSSYGNAGLVVPSHVVPLRPLPASQALDSRNRTRRLRVSRDYEEERIPSQDAMMCTMAALLP